MSDNTNLDWLEARLNLTRRSFLKTTAVGAAAVGASGLITTREAKAFAYEPYPTDDELTTVVTSCAHNYGSRHVLVAHKKGNVIVRLSTDDGRYQRDGAFGKYRRTILLAARFEASQKLGQPAVGGKLTADTLEVLRRHGYSTWAEQLKTDHKL